MCLDTFAITCRIYYIAIGYARSPSGFYKQNVFFLQQMKNWHWKGMCVFRDVREACLSVESCYVDIFGSWWRKIYLGNIAPRKSGDQSWEIFQAPVVQSTSYILVLS